MSRIDLRPHGVAHAVEPFFVERLTRQLFLSPVAWRDVRAADPQFELCRQRHQLGLRRPAPAGRRPTTARPPWATNGHWRRLRRAEPGDQDEPFATRLDARSSGARRRRLRQAGRRIEQHLHASKELRCKRPVPARRADQLLVALRHVQIDRRRDVAQVPHAFVEAAGHRPAFVEIERSAVVDDDADVVVAAKRVMPGQPVDEHRRFVPRHGSVCRIICWLLHSIRCVLMTPLGVPVDPDVNRIFATSSGRQPPLLLPTTLRRFSSRLGQQDRLKASSIRIECSAAISR